MHLIIIIFAERRGLQTMMTTTSGVFIAWSDDGWLRLGHTAAAWSFYENLSIRPAAIVGWKWKRDSKKVDWTNDRAIYAQNWRIKIIRKKLVNCSQYYGSMIFLSLQLQISRTLYYNIISSTRSAQQSKTPHFQQNSLAPEQSMNVQLCKETESNVKNVACAPHSTYNSSRLSTSERAERAQKIHFIRQ